MIGTPSLRLSQPVADSRIRLLSLFYHPPIRFGGAELSFLQVAKHWQNKKRLSHTILEPEPALISSSERVRLPKVGRSALGDFLQGSLFALLSVVRGVRNESDVLIAANNTLFNVLPTMLIAKISNIPWIIIVHHFGVLGYGRLETSFWEIYRMWRYFGRPRALLKAMSVKLSLVLARRSDGMISDSEVFANLSPRSTISGNAIDLREIDSVSPSRRRRRACYVGRLTPEKGVLELLAVWRHLV